MNLPLLLISILLVPLALAGLALVHEGLGRSRSAAHTMLSSLCVLSVAAICFVLFGAVLTGFAGGPSRVFLFGGTSWDWLGKGSLAASRAFVDRHSLQVCLQMLTVGMASLIPVSAGSDRWRLGAVSASTVLTAILIYPLFAHWVWGGGWLTALGVNFHIAPFVDMGGAAVVQVLGGLLALSVVWIIGPRRGKYAKDKTPAAIPGHNVVMVLFGCLLCLVGWIALEFATSSLFYAVPADQLVLVLMNAVLAASAGCVAAILSTQLRYHKVDASLSANGWVAGLVAGSAGCSLFSPLEAVIVGGVAGASMPWLTELLELRLKIDDPGGSISVHAVAGLWGLMAVGFFGTAATASRSDQLLAQVVGVATLIGFMLPLIHAAHLLLNRLVRFRVDADGDWQGMDVRELGAGAYPEFVVHADEFLPR